MHVSIPALCMAAFLAAGSASAGTVDYAAEYFAPYRPQTALDMVNHVPGFTLKDGNARRGFSGALGNVLIDGQRPIVKDQTLAAVLGTVPAAQVLRIEVKSGDAVAGDPSGEAILVNVVRTPAAGSGYASVGAEIGNRHRAAPSAVLSRAGRAGLTEYSLGAETYNLVRDSPTAYRTTDAQGSLIGTAYEPSPRQYYEYKLNGGLKRPLVGGSLGVSGQGFYSRYHQTPLRRDYAPGGAFTGGQATPYTETTASFEASGQYQRDLGPWGLDLVAFANRKHFFSDVVARQLDAAGATTGTTHQVLDRHSGETIGRAVISRALAGGRLEAAGEWARNTMNAMLELTYAAGGQTFIIPLPDSNSRIVEDRTEAHVGYVRDLLPDLGLDLRLTREHSELHFRGDTNQLVSYAFVKPSLTLTRRFGGGNQISLRIYRDADQIDFNDFLSAESLQDSVLNGGNPGLRPQTSWRTEIGADWHFGPRTAVSAKLYHYALSDTADLVPVTKGGVTYAAPGNIGHGRIDGANISATLPLDPWLAGASLTANLTVQTSQVDDPITGRHRPLSNLASHTATLSFRQNLPGGNLAWGMDYADASALTRYQLDLVDAARASPALNIYAERSRLGPFTLRLTLNSAGDQARLRRRAFYRPNRSGALDHVEIQTQSPGRWLNLTLSRAF